MKQIHRDSLIAIALLMSSVATAATLVITPSGYWQLTVDADGKPQLNKFDDILRLGEEPTPEPGPNDPATLTGKVRKWAGEVNEPGVAEAQALIMEFVAEQAQRGTFKTKPRMTEFTKDAIPKGLNAANSTKTDQWKAVWDDKIWPAVRKIEAAGGMNTIADQIKVWREIANGFKETSNAQWNVEFSAEENLEIRGEARPFLDQFLKILFQLLLEWLTNNPFEATT